jgi:hypothetical protein
MEPAKAPELANRFHDALAKGAAESNWQVIAPQKVRAQRGDKAKPCGRASCAAETAKAMNAKASALAHIKSVGKNYHIRVWILQGTQKIAAGETRCDICTLREALDSTEQAMAKAAKDARVKIPRGPVSPPVVAATKPPAKTGEPKTKTETKTNKEPATPEPSKKGEPAAAAAVKSDGQTASEKTATTDKAGTKDTTDANASSKAAAKSAPTDPPKTGENTPAPAPPKKDGAIKALKAEAKAESETKNAQKAKPARRKAQANRGVWPLWPSLVAGGFGLVGVVIGAPLIDMDGNGTNCTGAPLPDGSNCRDRFKTKAAGGVMMAIGIAGVLTSGVLLYLHFTSKEKQRQGIKSVSIVPDPAGGLLLGASGTF